MYSENLKNIRKHFKYTLDEMAKILEIPARTLGGYERKERNCSIELVTQLCNKLNINANWFCTGKGEMFNAPKFEDVQDEFEKKVVEIMKKQGVIK